MHTTPRYKNQGLHICMEVTKQPQELVCTLSMSLRTSALPTHYFKCTLINTPISLAGGLTPLRYECHISLLWRNSFWDLGYHWRLLTESRFCLLPHSVLRYHEVIPSIHSYSSMSSLTSSVQQIEQVPHSWCFYDTVQTKDLTESLENLY